MRHAAQIELATVSVLWLFARPQPGGEGLDRIDDRLEADGFEQVERVLRPLQDQRVHGVLLGVLGGRPRGRFRAMIAPRVKISPPQTPCGS